MIFAHRAAMRVAPMYFLESAPASRQSDLTALPVYRGLLIAGVAGACPTPAIKEAASAFAAAAFAAANVSAASESASASAFASALAAANAADAAAAAPASATSAADAADVAYAAAYAAAKEEIWENIRADAHLQTKGGDPLDRRSGQQKEPLRQNWAKASAALAAAGSDWEFWRRWYQGALDGEPLRPTWDAHWDLLEQIALIAAETWDTGPAAVAKEIARIDADLGARPKPPLPK